jgi:hypothetical protein
MEHSTALLFSNLVCYSLHHCNNHHHPSVSGQNSVTSFKFGLNNSLQGVPRIRPMVDLASTLSAFTLKGLLPLMVYIIELLRFISNLGGSRFGCPASSIVNSRSFESPVPYSTTGPLAVSLHIMGPRIPFGIVIRYIVLIVLFIISFFPFSVVYIINALELMHGGH